MLLCGRRPSATRSARPSSAAWLSISWRPSRSHARARAAPLSSRRGVARPSCEEYAPPDAPI
eukprot:8741678-Alexandrium_andersonii.AAC.1